MNMIEMANDLSEIVDIADAVVVEHNEGDLWATTVLGGDFYGLVHFEVLAELVNNYDEYGVRVLNTDGTEWEL